MEYYHDRLAVICARHFGTPLWDWNVREMCCAMIQNKYLPTGNSLGCVLCGRKEELVATAGGVMGFVSCRGREKVVLEHHSTLI